MELLNKILAKAFHPETTDIEAEAALKKAREIYIAKFGSASPSISIKNDNDETTKVVDKETKKVIIETGKITIGPILYNYYKEFMNSIGKTCWDLNLKWYVEWLSIENTDDARIMNFVLHYEGQSKEIAKLMVEIDELIEWCNKRNE